MQRTSSHIRESDVVCRKTNSENCEPKKAGNLKGIIMPLANDKSKGRTDGDTSRNDTNAVEIAGRLDAISKAMAVIESDLDGTIITANDNFLNAIGYRLEEVQGQHHRLFVEETYGRSAEY